MPFQSGKELFKVVLKRSSGRGKKPIIEEIFTAAFSKAQAKRFATFRKPGFSIVRVTKE